MNNQIFVVGTIHRETERIHKDDLVRYIMNYTPDVVLVEYPYQKPAELQELLTNDTQPAMDLAALAEIKKNPDVLLYPYDINSDRDRFEVSRFFEQVHEMCDGMNSYCASHRLETALRIMKNHVHYAMLSLESYALDTLDKMNSLSADIVVENCLEFIHSATIELLMNVPAFQTYREAWLSRQDFEKRRREAMVDSIIQYNARLSDKIIVVVCGYIHRYYLVNELLQNQARERMRLIA